MTTPFALAPRAPRYAELMQHTPEASVAGYVFGIVLVIVAAGGGLFFGFQLLKGDEYRQLILVSLVGPLAIFLCALIVLSMRRYQAAPVERHVALIRDESTEISVHTSVRTSKSGRATARTRVTETHHVLLELESGERQSHVVDEELARLVVPGDVGIAYVKAGDLLDFKPLQLPS